jgi:hypothetical protein
MTTTGAHRRSLTRTAAARPHADRVGTEYEPSPGRADGTAEDGAAAPAALSVALSRRDLAVLRAVAAGRCQMSGASGGSLTVDGLCCCDQFVAPRLTSAGLIAAAGPQPGPARLTASGRALLVEAA